MRRGFRFWALWGLAFMGMSGCAMTQRQRDCAVLGGMTGALIGGGVGAGVGPEVGSGDDDDDRVIGIGIGVGAGALLGGLAGYWWCAGEEAPPPPPPPPAPRAEAPPPPPAPRAAESKKIVLRGINFDFNKSNIKKEFAPVLDEAAQIMKDNPNVQVTIEGHTDSIGSDGYNQRLSERRAKAVKMYLVARGVEGSRLDTLGKGETDPVADNTKNGKDNPEGRAMNRRAELKAR